MLNGIDLFGVDFYSFSKIINPKHFPEVTPKVHFLGFRRIPFLLILSYVSTCLSVGLSPF